MAQTSTADDMVFSDGHSLQLARITKSVGQGHVATLDVPSDGCPSDDPAGVDR